MKGEAGLMFAIFLSVLKHFVVSLVLAFLMVNIPYVRQLLDKNPIWKKSYWNIKQEQEISNRTGKAFEISEQALGYLKDGLNERTARQLVELFMRELGAITVTISDTEKILATASSPQGDVKKGSGNGLRVEVPFHRSRQVAGTLVLQFDQSITYRSTEIVLAEGLGRLISYQISLIETEKLRVLLKDTELRSLQAQINPHFLFNTLNTIVSLIRTNPDQARFVMVQLSNFMRMNLKLMSSHLVSLEQELVLLESYIKIIQVRFADQLTVEMDIHENLNHYKLPPATIQPLVENCIQHGLKKVSKGGRIGIMIHKIDLGIKVTIQDNGSGIPEDRIEKLAKQQISSRMGNGIGVFNVNQRLTALLGDEAQLYIRNLPEGGCEVSFVLPELLSERRYY